nr:Ycf34 [Erythrotrichia longistipitata]
MCICINCYHVINCSTYYSIEKQHKKQQFDYHPSYVAQLPIIKVNITKNNTETELDWDVIECVSFVESPGKWLLSQKLLSI